MVMAEELLPLVADVIITKLLWLIMHERDKKKKNKLASQGIIEK